MLVVDENDAATLDAHIGFTTGRVEVILRFSDVKDSKAKVKKLSLSVSDIGAQNGELGFHIFELCSQR